MKTSTGINMNNKIDPKILVAKKLYNFKKKMDDNLPITLNLPEHLLLLREEFINIYHYSSNTYYELTLIPKSKLETDKSILHAYILFSRIHLLSRNIGQALEPRENASVWDYTTICTNVRILIEAVEMLFHIYLENVTNEERSLRMYYLNLRAFKYHKKYFEQYKSSKEIPEDEMHMINEAIDLIDETSKYLHERIAKIVGDQNDPSLNPKSKNYCHNQYLKHTRSQVEEKMGVLDPIRYIFLYQELSSYIHPYNICTDPIYFTFLPKFKISYNKMHVISQALEACILFLRYAVANIIHKLFLNQLSNLLSPKRLDEFRKILLALEVTPQCVSYAKKLKLVEYKLG